MSNADFTQVPYLCSGIVMERDELFPGMYPVEIYKSPMGKFGGPVYCTALYSTVLEDQYRVGTTVKVLIYFMYGGFSGGFSGRVPHTPSYIMGAFQDNYINKIPDNPLLEMEEKSIRFYNNRSLSGLSVDDYGNIIIATNSNVYSFMNPGGFSLEKDSNNSFAQNFRQTITNTPTKNGVPVIHFGMDSGSDDMDEVSRVTPSMEYVSYRRFTPQSAMPDKWVSLCEGSFSPFLGPNNNNMSLKPEKEILYNRIIHSGTKRITISGGEAGDSFFSIRVDNVISNEKYLPASPGAITGILGNLFKFSVSDSGEFELTGGGKSIPGLNLNSFKLSGSNGVLKLQASDEVVITNGDADEGLNYIKVPTKGSIEIESPSGLKVNGQEVVTKSFIDWFMQNFAAMFISAAPGAVTVPQPAALASFIVKSKLPAKAGGFTTSGIPVPLPGIIPDEDKYTTI